MTAPPTAIKPLPSQTVACLRSAVAITTLSQAVEKLVCNAIDAGATAIDVSVGLDSGFADVRDDGVGMGLTSLQKASQGYDWVQRRPPMSALEGQPAACQL